MSHPVSQFKAALAVSRYSLLAMLRSPTSIVFSLLFPIIFIVVFGSINVNGPQPIKVAMAANSDTANVMYRAIKAIPNISLVRGESAQEQEEDLRKGRLVAIITIKPNNVISFLPHFAVHLKAANSSGQQLDMLQSILDEAIGKINKKMFRSLPSVAVVDVVKEAGRAYNSIDFILPGQLGFSLLMAGVYGSSFLLFSMRQNLVFKRLRATPIKRRAIIAGEMLCRFFFHVIAFVIMVALGYFLFKFTLVNGIETFFEMLIFSIFGLFIFMGIGFIISGLVENENAIAPIANTVVLPQILLCGLFFPVGNYPHWLEQFCNVLPLTLFVDGLRKIAFEGTHLWQLPLTIGGLVLWTLVIIPISVKSFKWE